MRNVLIDSSVWIDFLAGKPETEPMLELIDNNLICTNDLILTELLPFIIASKKDDLADMLLAVTKIPLTINWQDLKQMQLTNIRNGINKVGIPDLVIAQNMIQNNLELFTFDKHFKLMQKVFDFKLFKI